MKWAYGALTDDGNQIPPTADRLNWLTSARHICRYWSISEQITSELYKLLAAEREEYWRHMFYIVLDRKELKRKEYFMAQNLEANLSDGLDANIELESAKIINHFATWSEGMEDPTENVDKDINVSLTKGPFRWGLADYNDAHERYVEKLNNEYEKVLEPKDDV
jgi:hypothetical protein